MCRLLPHLMLLRGIGWDSKHWVQLFSLLGIQGRTKATVTLGDFVTHADAVASSADAIRKLDGQAQAEAVLRKAFDELDMWGFERRFQMTDGADSKGAQVCAALETLCSLDCMCAPHRSCMPMKRWHCFERTTRQRLPQLSACSRKPANLAAGAAGQRLAQHGG